MDSRLPCKYGLPRPKLRYGSLYGSGKPNEGMGPGVGGGTGGCPPSPPAAPEYSAARPNGFKELLAVIGGLARLAARFLLLHVLSLNECLTDEAAKLDPGIIPGVYFPGIL